MTTATPSAPSTIPAGWPPVADPAAAPPRPLADVGVQSFAMLRDGVWVYILGYDAGRMKAQIAFMRPAAATAVCGSISAQALAIRATPPAPILKALTDAIAARIAARTARRQALDSIRKGARMEFDNKGKAIVGTVVRVNAKTVGLLEDNGNEWRVTPGLLRPSTVAAPAALPEHPTMARWSLGKRRYGLMSDEGRTWEQPLLLDGKRVGLLREEGHGGSLDIICSPAMHSAQLCADAKAWAAAVGEDADDESYALWAEWTTEDRPFGRAYETVAKRYGV